MKYSRMLVAACLFVTAQSGLAQVKDSTFSSVYGPSTVPQKEVKHDKKFEKLQKKHPSWSDADIVKVEEKRVWIGMTYDMWREVYGWFPANAVNTTYREGNTQIQMVFESIAGITYMYFDNGILVGTQNYRGSL
jgi:hypothetical protein